MNITTEEKQEVVIKFAGDSGDGMQLTGNEFTRNTALEGSDIATFPDFPAEIRAPQGTLAGVSGFQLHFGSRELFTPGDAYDVLVAMNAAALKSNIDRLKKGGIIIANIAGFDKKNLRLAKIEEGDNPLENDSLSNYSVYEVDVTKLTRECLKESPLGTKEKDRSKNMFVLGFLYWMYNRKMDSSINFLNEKFKKRTDILEANLKVMKAGYHYGETTETFTTRYNIGSAKLVPGTYRSIMGNQATVLGLITAARKANLKLFYGSYPITPASDILHQLARHKNYGVRTFQAEDEIAAVCAAIGASYGGDLAITGTSGPGVALKAEAIGLALMLELPLLVCNIQRGGPSTGLPTKTEQADLLQALYGRNGECPMPVIAACSPADCFETAFEACKITLQHMTPVMFLSDGYIANGAEPWRFPKAADIPSIEVKFKKELAEGEIFYPYARDERLVREWAIPGTATLSHRLGGLEKEDLTGNVSYDPANHQKMIRIRAEKVAKIADFIPDQKIDAGPAKGKVLVMGWGSTYGAIKSAVRDLLLEGYEVAHTHLRYLNPFPKNLGEILDAYEHIVIPEMNEGQLASVIKSHFLKEVISYNKVQGVPITRAELFDFVKGILSQK